MTNVQKQHFGDSMSPLTVHSGMEKCKDILNQYVVGSGNSIFLQNSLFRKHKKPKIQLFTSLNHQKTQTNSRFFGFSSCAVNLKKRSTFFQNCKGIFKFVQKGLHSFSIILAFMYCSLTLSHSYY